MKALIVANWKCNPTTLKEAKKLFNSVKKGTRNIKKAEVVICPPFIYLLNLKSKILNLKLGAQNCFWEKKGAYTGEISPLMLKNIGCKYVIVGHSERRGYFIETDKMVNRKLEAVIEAKMAPIFCIGEAKKERDQGKTDDVIKNQINSGLKGISAAKFSKIIIAYEPIWAIGTGNPCDAEEAQKMGLVIRKIISKIYNQAVSKNLRILYGGSVNSKNAAGYVKEACLQGLLVGGASLDGREFVDLIKKIC